MYARNFPSSVAHQTHFTANANQSSKSVTCARVAGTEVPTKQVLPRMPTYEVTVLSVPALPVRKPARVTGGKIDFATLKIDFLSPWN